ncbi:hypothetical protein MKW92_031438 [Papaver armeniacum]|nr:hypothetical protein MKW92_031438 [Papaver armeniacum]
MKMSSSTTQLVVALSLCLLLLGFSNSAEASARPITDVVGAAANEQRCDLFKVHCAEDAECIKLCQSKGYGGGFCLSPPASSNREEKIVVNRFAVVTLFGCCCPRQ